MMMMPWHENNFCITGPVCRESTGHDGFPLQRASDPELRYFLCCQPEQTVEQTVELPMIWHIIKFLWCSCNAIHVTRWMYWYEIYSYHKIEEKEIKEKKSK